MSGHNELSSPQLEPTTTVSSPPMSLATGQEGLAAVSKQAICEFLDRLNFTFPEYKRDLELEARVNEATRGWESGEYMRPYVVTAILITVMAYGHLSSIDAKLAVALYTALLVALDDPAVFDSLSAQKLPFRLCAGSAQRDGDVLGELSRNLAGMWGIYPDFAASAVCTSALRFVNACFLENMGTDAMLRPGMRSFVDYQRGMSGVADAYACFIWEKARFPDVRIYLEAML
ncbi:hypothetical protein AcV5_005283 [Taiwanofungus camphoratus]|nr:hypothetical protein AcV5_005283 [Antrodia cinnamomea]